MIDTIFWEDVAARWRIDNDGTDIVPITVMPSVPGDDNDDMNNDEIDSILADLDLGI